MKKALDVKDFKCFFMEWGVECGICTFAIEEDNFTLVLPQTWDIE